MRQWWHRLWISILLTWLKPSADNLWNRPHARTCKYESLRAIKVVSHSSVALWYAFNNLFCIYKVTFAIYEMFWQLYFSQFKSIMNGCRLSQCQCVARINMCQCVAGLNSVKVVQVLTRWQLWPVSKVMWSWCWTLFYQGMLWKACYADILPLWLTMFAHIPLLITKLVYV